jgi:uncharacterized protein
VSIARQGNILAIQKASGEVVGFHAHNLQVAQLDHLAWTAISAAQTPTLANTESANAELEEARSELLTWDAEIDGDVKDQRLSQNVRSFTINIAQICNLKCTYCAAGGDGTYGSKVKEIDLAKLYDQLRYFLHRVPDGGQFVVTFLGGEPLIYPDAIRSIHRFIQLQVLGRGIEVRYDLVTNGTLVTPAIAELLCLLRCHVTVSLDGPPAINDLQRPTATGKGSTIRTLRGLENLLKVRDRLGSVSIGSVFGKHYVDVVATYRFLQPYKLDSLKFDFAAEKDDGEASQNYVDAICQVAEIAYTEGGEKELRRIGLFDRYFQILDARERIHNHCGAGKSLLQVDTSGKLYVCQWFVNDPAEVVGEGTTVDHKKLEAYADPIRTLNGCDTCWARHLCGGGCMFVNKVKTGSKHTKDAEFCARTRSIIAKGIEYYAEARK